MDRKSKILLWFTVILALCSFTFTFVKTVILGDFDIIESNNTEAETSSGISLYE